MASIKLKGDTSGEITIDVPAVAGTNTLTLPASTGNILTDGAALPAIDGSALTNLPAPAALSTASGSAPSYSARAWINFNGQGTVAIRASANVSSITDNGTGLYRVNFTTAMPDTDYAVSGAAQYDTAGNSNVPIIGLPRTATSQGTGYVDISSGIPNGSNYDCLKVLVIVHR